MSLEGEEGEVEIPEAVEEEEEVLVEEEVGVEEVEIPEVFVEEEAAAAAEEEEEEAVDHLQCRRGDLAKRFNLDSSYKHGGQSDEKNRHFCFITLHFSCQGQEAPLLCTSTAFSLLIL